MLKIDSTKKYALAVSGGIDSMVMLRIFSELSPRPDFFAVTVNHNIRSNALQDCQFVKDACVRLGVECRVYSVDVPTYAHEHKISEETAARILRYEVLDGLPDDRIVCLAHHADDNAETVLMHILRGSGLCGARGISLRNGKYFRPLLNMTREEILAYANNNGVEYVYDQTNDETKYARNFVRQKVMPLLKEIQPNAVANILRFADIARQDDEYINEIADISSVKFGENKAEIPLDLLRLNKAVSSRIIRKVFAELGVYKDIEKDHVDAILDLANNSGGKRLCLPFGYVVYNDYDKLTAEQFYEQDVQIFECPFSVGTTHTSYGTIDVTDEKRECLRFDLNKIPSGAVFRTKRQGDVFVKFGGGTKSLKKYLIDKKIPARIRDSLVVLAAGNEILAICGVEISEKIRVGKTSKIYYLDFKGDTDAQMR